MTETQLRDAISSAQRERTNLNGTILPELYSRRSRLRSLHDQCPSIFSRYQTNIRGFEIAENRARNIPNMRSATWCARGIAQELSGELRARADAACANIPQKIEREITRVEREIRVRENRVETINRNIRDWQEELDDLLNE